MQWIQIDKTFLWEKVSYILTNTETAFWVAFNSNLTIDVIQLTGVYIFTFDLSQFLSSSNRCSTFSLKNIYWEFRCTDICLKPFYLSRWGGIPRFVPEKNGEEYDLLDRAVNPYNLKMLRSLVWWKQFVQRQSRHTSPNARTEWRQDTLYAAKIWCHCNKGDIWSASIIFQIEPQSTFKLLVSLMTKQLWPSGLINCVHLSISLGLKSNRMIYAWKFCLSYCNL